MQTTITLILQEAHNGYYIGFDIDSKKTIVFVVQKDKKEIYTTPKTDTQQMKNLLQKQRHLFGALLDKKLFSRMLTVYVFACFGLLTYSF